LGNLQAKLPPYRRTPEETMSNEDNIKIGDNVRRRAGGPTMTVVDVEEEDSGQLVIYCVWLDEKNNEQQGQYPARALILL
jgi:uncharacterized protein YodC (DUF2158 family)